MLGIAGTRVTTCPVIWLAKDRSPRRTALFVEREGVLRTSGHVEDLFVSCVRQIVDEGVLLVILAHSEPPDCGLHDAEAHAIILETVSYLKERGIAASAFLYCTHPAEMQCGCRHPQPGLLHSAASVLKLDLRSSVYIGASIADLEAGVSAGVATLLVDLQNAENYAETFALAHDALAGSSF